MSGQLDSISRHDEIRNSFLKNWNYLIPRYRALSEASQRGEAIPEIGGVYNKLLDLAKNAPPEDLATMFQAAVDAAVWTVEGLSIPEGTSEMDPVGATSIDTLQADAEIRSRDEVKPHRFHPDADAGLAQFLMVASAVSTVKWGARAILDFQGDNGSLLVNGPALIEQLKKVSWGTAQRAMRPMFNEALISAYAALQNKHGIKRGDSRPEVEFLRHVRNASAHGNVFTLRGTEPIMRAIWKGKEITSELDGTVLIYKFLKPGDVLILIDDVFQLVDPQ